MDLTIIGYAPNAQIFQVVTNYSTTTPEVLLSACFFILAIWAPLDAFFKRRVIFPILLGLAAVAVAATGLATTPAPTGPAPDQEARCEYAFKLIGGSYSGSLDESVIAQVRTRCGSSKTDKALLEHRDAMKR